MFKDVKVQKHALQILSALVFHTPRSINPFLQVLHIIDRLYTLYPNKIIQRHPLTTKSTNVCTCKMARGRYWQFQSFNIQHSMSTFAQCTCSNKMLMRDTFLQKHSRFQNEQKTNLAHIHKAIPS